MKSKESTISKSGGQSGNKEFSNSVHDASSDIYPLNRSATDPSNCASSEISTECEFKQVNISNSCQTNSSNIEVSENLSSSVPHTEKKFKERPSFKIENHIRQQNSNQDSLHKTSTFSQEDTALVPEADCISTTQTLNELKLHDINFTENCPTSKEPSSSNIEISCDTRNFKKNLPSQVGSDTVSQLNINSNEDHLDVDKQIEEENYLEFGFEEPKKNRKPPPRLFNNKKQNNQKKGSKTKQQSNKKKTQNSANFVATDKDLSISKKIVSESPESVNNILPNNLVNNQENFKQKPVSNTVECNIETAVVTGSKELLLPSTEEVAVANLNILKEENPILISETEKASVSTLNILKQENTILTTETEEASVSTLNSLKEENTILTTETEEASVSTLNSLKEENTILTTETEEASISTLNSLKEENTILTTETEEALVFTSNSLKEENAILTTETEEAPVATLNSLREENVILTTETEEASVATSNSLKEENVILTTETEEAPVAILNSLREENAILTTDTEKALVATLNSLKEENTILTTETEEVSVSTLNSLKEENHILNSETIVSDHYPTVDIQKSIYNTENVDAVKKISSLNEANEVIPNREVSKQKVILSNCELSNTDTNTKSNKSTFDSSYLEKPDNNSEKVEKEILCPKRNNSIVSISCYGNEEFEILGNEANKLAEELTDIDKPLEFNFESMTSRSSTDECTNNFSSISLENDTKSERMLAKRDSLLLQVGDSEAGPDIATGLTSNDLKCASEFFREAAELESQIRRNIASSVGSYADFGVEADRTSCASESEIYNSNSKTEHAAPPREERSAPEGTSSPDPKSLEDSEVRSRLPRSPNGSFSPEVNELLKKQALEFEEKLLRQGIVAAEKEKELHEMLKEEQNHLQKITTSRDMLLKLVEQYKGMLGALVSEKEKANKGQEEKLKVLETEKVQALEDLSNVEAAFSDVHRKYERTKQIVDTLRRNEETLRTAVADYEQKLLKQERKYLELQKHAEEKIKLANDEFESLRRTNDQEMTKMGALLKKAEMKIISLQENLERKNRENQELTQLCDDLISKVGS